eukprot:COSAG05_NODE_688_length_7906_cov_24.548098_12_plen_82_part_00
MCPMAKRWSNSAFPPHYTYVQLHMYCSHSPRHVHVSCAQCSVLVHVRYTLRARLSSNSGLAIRVCSLIARSEQVPEELFYS